MEYQLGLLSEQRINMNERQRHNKITRNLHRKQSLCVAEIVDLFNVSPATARRDVTKLDELRHLKKIRNGAEHLSKEKMFWSPINVNNTAYFDKKSKLARQVSRLCKHDSTLVTTFILDKELCKTSIQIVTNYFSLG